MATTTTCRRCGEEVHMTRMSLLDYYPLCRPCRQEEGKDGVLEVIKIEIQDKVLSMFFIFFFILYSFFVF